MCLSPNKLHPRVDELGREQILQSRDDVAKFRNVFPSRIKCIFCGFGINFTVNVIVPDQSKDLWPIT
jgi:hypothetical protein